MTHRSFPRAEIPDPLRRTDQRTRTLSSSSPECLNALLPKCLLGVGHDEL